jgi:hypothetical protein
MRQLAKLPASVGLIVRTEMVLFAALFGSGQSDSKLLVSASCQFPLNEMEVIDTRDTVTTASVFWRRVGRQQS